MSSNVNWPEAIQPLLQKYKGKQHPLEYKNIYQLVVMVVLSAQDSDRNINKIAPELFKAFPDMKALSKATDKTLQSHISKVRNFGNKTKWLLGIAEKIKWLAGRFLKFFFGEGIGEKAREQLVVGCEFVESICPAL